MIKPDVNDALYIVGLVALFVAAAMYDWRAVLIVFGATTVLHATAASVISAMRKK